MCEPFTPMLRYQHFKRLCRRSASGLFLASRLSVHFKHSPPRCRPICLMCGWLHNRAIHKCRLMLYRAKRWPRNTTVTVFSGPSRLFYNGLRLNGPWMWNLGRWVLQTTVERDPQLFWELLLSSHSKWTILCLDVGHVWLGRTHRGPNLWGSVGVFIWFCCSIFDIFSLYIRNQWRRPQRFTLWSKQRNSLHVKLAELKRLKSNGPLQTQLWSQGPPPVHMHLGWTGYLRLIVVLGLFSTLTFWHILKYESKHWTNWFILNLSMEDQPDLSPCGGSRLPLGVPQGSL